MQGMTAGTTLGPNVTVPSDLNKIMVKLDHYRQQSERLSLMNELHRRLADAVDLQSIIEAFSVWLMPQVDHELVAYHHPENGQSHIFCSCHGPERRRAIKVTERLFERPSLVNCRKGNALEGYHVHCWHLPEEEEGQLLLLRKHEQLPEDATELVDGGVAVLDGSVQRAVHYEKLIHQANRDSLTGLANRRVFDERIDAFLERAKRHNHSLTLASMDLDNFKKINDSLGHIEGDRVLTEVAKVFAGKVRKSDLLVRMGGDEFFLLLPDTKLCAAKTLAERVCQAVRDLEIGTPSGDYLGVSIGLAQWHPGLSREDWIQRADETLYQAKAAGRSRVCVGETKTCAISSSSQTELS
jgi:diguanylate cyclase (GGDEF)-like protein